MNNELLSTRQSFNEMHVQCLQFTVGREWSNRHLGQVYGHGTVECMRANVIVGNWDGGHGLAVAHLESIYCLWFYSMARVSLCDKDLINALL